ncbi:MULTISPECIES: outer membrane protein assembly factor BamA [Lentibacter]|jgi:outer membrane protein insertion porin family|uniref:Outer membrane protein assembly factor BamA n=4 Tax=Lentibacter algarum TaxID=576131 RepID=A0A1H3KQB9_9RHOB|nr:outer membrane protein assembly factor BamA [Lentibacter algarum]WIF31806.1 outer membrane protein Omp [Lentibacter algarum]SDY54321.1 Beta-barrel assembly machine subunit BamA [Lentibacter algarum]
MASSVTERNARTGKKRTIRNVAGTAVLAAFSMGFVWGVGGAIAQNYSFNSVAVEGNKRIETGTILTYAGIARGETVSAGDINEAYQRILASGLFESVEIVPQGGKLVIKVTEFPTINQISFEGNERLKDNELSSFIKLKPRLVFSPTQAERDAVTLTEAYAENGRLAARITPKIIRRSDNRVDLVFEIFEGGNTEVSRIGFVGNQVYSDRRLRRVLESKQAGLLRALIRKDTFVEDRLQFDQQVLRDFYVSRGYVDFRTTAVNAELARERDGYFLTFNVEEGQQFAFGEITTISEIEDVDSEVYQDTIKLRAGETYSPSLVENAIARMERLAIRNGQPFLRVEPRITRNDRDLTLDVEFVLSKGERIFVERIDIEGNATTLDRVVRRQFRVAEGDPFNPREIRESAERIRALGFFGDAQVNAREGSTPNTVIVDVDVAEKPTGSLNFGGTYSTDNGFGLVAQYTETNFLGRGQTVRFRASGATDNTNYGLYFEEPAFLGRDVKFFFDIGILESESANANYNTSKGIFATGLEFPLGERARLGVNYKLDATKMSVSSTSTIGSVLTNEVGLGRLKNSSVGYSYEWDSRKTSLDNDEGLRFLISQDFGGLGGDDSFVKSKAKLIAQRRFFNDEITLRATLAGGAVSFSGAGSRATDRWLFDEDIMRGFAADGIGPRELNGSTVNDALGGNYFATAKFEALFPLGLPEEYGITGGVFYDIGNVWGLDKISSVPADTFYESGSFRHVAGVSIFWETPIGPMRLNWSKALKKEDHDIDQNFEFTISTEF